MSVLRVSDVVDMMETIAPAGLAESWDTPGLQIGRGNQPVTKIMIALDPLPQVIENAVHLKADMLITHHPLFIKPLKGIDLDTPAGEIIELSVFHKLAVFAAHTNLDRVPGGLNDFLADLTGLTHRRIIADGDKTGQMKTADPEKTRGLVRTGELDPPETLRSLGQRLARILTLPGFRLVGDPKRMVQKVAVCTGGGGSLLPEVIASDVQAYITGDIRYHAARDAETAGIGILDIGHFGSERIVIDLLAKKLGRLCSDRGFQVDILPCKVEAEPFQYIYGENAEAIWI